MSHCSLCRTECKRGFCSHMIIISIGPRYHLASIKPLTRDFIYLSIKSARVLINDFGSYIIPTLGSRRESTTICKSKNCRMITKKVNCTTKWLYTLYQNKNTQIHHKYEPALDHYSATLSMIRLRFSCQWQYYNFAYMNT